MSAWLCSEEHLNLIVNAHPKGDEAAFKMLLAENLRSLQARYGHDTTYIAELYEDAERYSFRKIEPRVLIKVVYDRELAERPDVIRHYPSVGTALTAGIVKAQIANSCDSYDYQACETSDYDQTPAKAFVREVRDQVGYEKITEAMIRSTLWGF